MNWIIKELLISSAVSFIGIAILVTIIYLIGWAWFFITLFLMFTVYANWKGFIEPEFFD